MLIHRWTIVPAIPAKTKYINVSDDGDCQKYKAIGKDKKVTRVYW